MARADWGRGKQQVYLLKKEICELLRAGENLEGIYQQLVVGRDLSISHRTFKRHAARLRDGMCSASTTPSGSARPANGTRPDPSAATVPTSVSPSPPPKTFAHTPVADETVIDALFGGGAEEDSERQQS